MTTPETYAETTHSDNSSFTELNTVKPSSHLKENYLRGIKAKSLNFIVQETVKSPATENKAADIEALSNFINKESDMLPRRMLGLTGVHMLLLPLSTIGGPGGFNSLLFAGALSTFIAGGIYCLIKDIRYAELQHLLKDTATKDRKEIKRLASSIHKNLPNLPENVRIATELTFDKITLYRNRVNTEESSNLVAQHNIDRLLKNFSTSINLYLGFGEEHRTPESVYTASLLNQLRLLDSETQEQLDALTEKQASSFAAHETYLKELSPQASQLLNSKEQA